MNRDFIWVPLLMIMFAMGGLVAGFIVGDGTSTPVFAWRRDFHGPGLEMVPYTGVVKGNDSWHAKPAADTDGIETVSITARRWDVRWRDTEVGEGFMLYDGDTMYHDGDPTKLWFRFVEYHPPEIEDGDGD